MWPPPKAPEPSPTAVQKAAKAEIAPPPPPNYFNLTLKDSMVYTAGLGSMIGM